MTQLTKQTAFVDKDYIEVNLDLHDKSSTSQVEQCYTLMQNNHNSRVLRCILTKGCGLLPVDLSNSVLTLYIKKADLALVMLQGKIVDSKNGIVDFTLTRQALAIADKLTCEVVKTGSDKSTLSFPNFTLEVDSTIVDEELVESTDDFSALGDMLGDVAKWDSEFDSKYTEIDNRFNSQHTTWEGKFENKYNNLERDYAKDLTEVKDGLIETNTQLSSITRLTRDFKRSADEADDTGRFQRAIDFCSLQGYKLLITEDILISSTIILKDNTHVEGSNKLFKITTNIGSPGNGLVLLKGVGKKNITISNVTLVNKCFGETFPTPIGSLDGTGSCILLADCENICIDKCDVKLGGGYSGVEGVANIWLSCCRYARITNNNVEYGNNLICVDRWYANYNDDGIDRSGIFNLDIVVSHNNLHFASGRGVALENINGKGSVIISNNTISGCGYSAIDGRNFSNCIITDNVIDGDLRLKRDLATYLGTDDTNYSWNTWDNMQYGIELLDEAKDCLVSNNVVRNIKVHGLVMYNTRNSSVKNNKIYNVGAIGIYISNKVIDVEDVSISDNDIQDCGQDGLFIDKRDNIMCKNIIINSNNIKVGRDGMNISNLHYALISNNIISSTTYRKNRGIVINSVSHSSINGNVIREFMYGIVVEKGVRIDTASKIVNNKIALYLTNCNDCIMNDHVTVCDVVFGGANNARCDGYNTKFIEQGSIKTAHNLGVNVKAKLSMDGTPTQPSKGAWEIGDIIINSTPNLNKQIGIICVGNSGEGNVGLWKTYGKITEN